VFVQFAEDYIRTFTAFSINY